MKINFPLSLLKAFTFTLLSIFLSFTVGKAQKNNNSNNNKDHKITICHLPPGNPENVQTISIDESAWPAHAEHGDSIGECDSSKTNNGNSGSNEKITICHFPPGNPENVQTITISVSAWAAHEAHGDALGNCDIPDNNDEGDDNQDDDNGDNNGDNNQDDDNGNDDQDDDNSNDDQGNSNQKITICHYPPGNPENVQSIEIAQSAWEAHAAHGDTMGECDLPNDDQDDDNGDDDQDDDNGDDDQDDDNGDDDQDDDNGDDDQDDDNNDDDQDDDNGDDDQDDDNGDDDQDDDNGDDDQDDDNGDDDQDDDNGDDDQDDDNGDDDQDNDNDQKITICHYPPGNPENVKSMEIAQSAWEAHAAHGDTMGECDLPNDDQDDDQDDDNGDDDQDDDNGDDDQDDDNGDDDQDDDNGDDDQDDDNGDDDQDDDNGDGDQDDDNGDDDEDDDNGDDDQDDDNGDDDQDDDNGDDDQDDDNGDDDQDDDNGDDDQDDDNGDDDQDDDNGDDDQDDDNGDDDQDDDNGDDDQDDDNGDDDQDDDNGDDDQDDDNGDDDQDDDNGDDDQDDDNGDDDQDDDGDDDQDDNTPEEPVTDEPTVDEPVIEEPTTEEPVVEGPEEEVHLLPTAKIETKDLIICEGEEASFKIDLTGTGPWTITYKEGTVISNLTVTEEEFNLISKEEGTTFLGVRDHNGKEGVAQGVSNIVVADMPEATIEGGGSFCEGEKTNLTVNLSGEGPWTFTYTDGTEIAYSVSTENSEYNLEVEKSGNYEVLTVGGKHCFNSKVSFDATLVSQIEKASASLSGTTNICLGEEGLLEFAMRGAGPYTVYYTDGTDTYSFETEEAGYTLNTSKGGNYEITKILGRGCEGSFEGGVNLIVADKMLGAPTIGDEYCEGDEIKLSLDLKSGTPDNINWTTNGSGTIETDGSNVYYIPNSLDEEVTFTATMTNHCESAEVSAKTKINKVNALFEINPKVDEILANVEYEFSAIADDADQYEWSFGDGTTDLLETAIHKFENTGYHSISLTATVGECSKTETVEIEIYENNNLFIPSVFNPFAANPENRTVKVYGEDISYDNFKFQIVNRWGLVVYQTTNLTDASQHGWDGMKRGDAQENGVYTFTLVGKFKSGKQFEKTGTITLVK